MKPFNLERALAGDKVITRDGREVSEIHYFKTATFCSFNNKVWKIVVVINGLMVIYDECGKHHVNKDDDLVMAPVKVKYYFASFTDNLDESFPSTRLYKSYDKLINSHPDLLNGRVYKIHEIEIEE